MRSDLSPLLWYPRPSPRVQPPSHVSSVDDASNLNAFSASLTHQLLSTCCFASAGRSSLSVPRGSHSVSGEEPPPRNRHLHFICASVSACRSPSHLRAYNENQTLLLLLFPQRSAKQGLALPRARASFSKALPTVSIPRRRNDSAYQ